MAFAPVPGGQLYFEIHGEGPPLLLATGLGGLAAFWQPYLADLARDFRVVVYDHRGTGRSTISPPPYSVDDMAADVVALMDHLGIADAHFCGHSTGGAIGQILGARHPARVRSLLLAATWGRRDPYFKRCFDCRLPLLRQVGVKAYVEATSLLLYPPDWIARDFEQLLALEAVNAGLLVRPDILEARIAAICDFDLTAEAGRIAAPTLIVAARDDMTTPPFLAEALHRSIARSWLHVLDWGGHMFPLTAQAEFAGMLREWLACQTPGADAAGVGGP